MKRIRLGHALAVLLVTTTTTIVGLGAPASATTLQTIVVTPIDGRVTSDPSEPHHRPYGGDYAFDVAGSGSVYARFRSTTGDLALTVASIGRACGSGVFAHGGDRITLNVFINGAHVGTVAYSHLTDFSYTSGAVPLGARLGRVATAADGVTGSATCWTGPHVHIEPRNNVRYGCYAGGLLNTSVNAGSALGLLGGEWAGAANTPCPAGVEAAQPFGSGAFVRRPDGAVFRMAGGAPLYLPSWDPFGGPQPTADMTWAQYNSLPPFPAPNTFITGLPSGRVFRVVGEGRRYYVSSWAPYGGVQPTVAVHDWAIDQCDHLRCEPFGSFDDIVGGSGTVTVRGWVMDPDTTAPITVHAYADGAWLGQFTAGGSRPDVDEVFHRGSHYGFDTTLSLAKGDHRVCVYGINVAQGSGNPEIGCRSVSVNAPLATPNPTPEPTLSPTPTSVPMPTSGTTKATSALSARGPRTPVNPGNRVRVRATLTINEQPAAGRRLELLRRTRSAGRWIVVSGARTAGTRAQRPGQVLFRVTVRRGDRFLVRFAGDAATTPARTRVRIRLR